ncbi:MAG: nucleoside-diphosphate sugar epimerase/dehydratase, partial [Patescibacteria group bacterium]|nr:nucleoside-diphosphate sugar epimerase/dehydratase [Patescibacteria group bacterium]
MILPFLKYIKRTSKTRFLFFFFSDIILISFSVFLSFLLRFDANIPSQYFHTIFSLAILVLLFSLPVFYFFRLYSFSWSYVSTDELISLAKAVVISFAFLIIVFLVFNDRVIFQNFPRSTLFIIYFLVFIFCGAIRFSKRIYFQLFITGIEKGKEKTLIIGAGDAGEQILRSILASRDNFYLPVGFVDDNSIKQGVTIHGLKVLGKISDIPDIIRDKGVKQMIIALPSVSSGIIKESVELGRKAGLKNIKIIPSITEIIDGQISTKDLRQIQIEDLLGREPVSLNMDLIEDFIKTKKILITGASGSIGSELAKQVSKFSPSQLILLDQDETGIFNISKEIKEKFPYLKTESVIADIRDKHKINKIFQQFKPNIIFHAAAYKHVPLMEENSDEAIKNNVFGTEVVAKAALNSNVEKFILISTDKAVNPVSVMGATKRAGEMICQYLNQRNGVKFISVRFGNVLNSRGSVIPIFKEQIKKGGPVTVTHPDMKRYFMITSEACLLVLQSAQMGEGGEVFVLDMGKPIKIIDL